MPKYSHKCADCACITEAEYSIKEEKQIACEVCQGPTKRVILPSNFILVGDSWAKHGYDVNGRKQ